MTVKVKKNDNVLVLTGKDKGTRSKVLRVFPRERRAIVEKVNFVKRHTRPNPRQNIKGGVVEREGPVNLSNLMVICKECDKPARAGYRVLEDGSKVRHCRRCDGTWD